MMHNTTGFPNLEASNGIFLAVSIALPEKKKNQKPNKPIHLYIYFPSVIKNKRKKSGFLYKRKH